MGHQTKNMGPSAPHFHHIDTQPIGDVHQGTRITFNDLLTQLSRPVVDWYICWPVWIFNIIITHLL